uniref:Uncharacterized protein n=1 Tax=Heliothis virescens TaxID=7102 RepID=A0A2A4JVP5_HELVI
MHAVFLLVFKIIFAEARVFCQDRHAMPWKTAGHACPITCSTIITAIDRLKQYDYQYLVKQRVRKKINMSETDIFTISQELHEQIFYNRKSDSLLPENQHLKLYHTYHKLLSNKEFIESLKMEAKKMTAELNMSCSKMAAHFYRRINNLRCSRKFNKRSHVVGKFTKFLNKYADEKYPFNEELSAMILQKLEGSRTMRFGVVDFNTILGYLRKSLRYHKSRSRAERVIRLQSKNCLTIYVPGCYCKVGYVERELQCVNPEHCIANPSLTKYLERIILY